MADQNEDKLYKESIVIDSCAPMASQDDYYKAFYDGGLTAICATIYPLNAHLPETIAGIEQWYKRINEHNDELLLVRSIHDIYRAKSECKLGIVLAFQNCLCLQYDLGLIEVYRNLGVLQMQLCYNYRNPLGDGCTEPEDAGLSSFGEKAVKEMNRVGVVVDLSHTGYKTTMEAMEVVTRPPIFSHGNARGVYDCRRNLRDDQVRKCAEMGGVIGINGCSYFVGENRGENQTINDMIDHLDYYVHLVGIDHVGIGMDYFSGNYPYLSLEKAQALYKERLMKGIWSADTYPPPPWYVAREVETPELMKNWVPALKARGFADSDIRRILGENWLRIYKENWK